MKLKHKPVILSLGRYMVCRRPSSKRFIPNSVVVISALIPSICDHFDVRDKACPLTCTEVHYIYEHDGHPYFNRRICEFMEALRCGAITKLGEE